MSIQRSADRRTQGAAADAGHEATAPEGDGEGGEYSFTNLGDGSLGRGAARSAFAEEASNVEARSTPVCTSMCLAHAAA